MALNTYGVGGLKKEWRRVAESNRSKRICNPLHNRFANPPSGLRTIDRAQTKTEPLRFRSSKLGAGDESRTRDLNLGKVALYQLSYSRNEINYSAFIESCKCA